MNAIQLTQNPIFIQMFQSVLPAGFPVPQEAEHGTRISLDEQLFVNKNTSFLFRVTGDSMIEAGIFEGDRIIVDKSVKPEHNHIVVAIVNREFTVKRLYQKQGIIKLLPENPAYKPIELKEGDQLEIWGVVTSTMRKLV